MKSKCKICGEHKYVKKIITYDKNINKNIECLCDDCENKMLEEYYRDVELQQINEMYDDYEKSINLELNSILKSHKV